MWELLQLKLPDKVNNLGMAFAIAIHADPSLFMLLGDAALTGAPVGSKVGAAERPGLTTVVMIAATVIHNMMIFGAMVGNLFTNQRVGICCSDFVQLFRSVQQQCDQSDFATTSCTVHAA